MAEQRVTRARRRRTGGELLESLEKQHLTEQAPAAYALLLSSYMREETLLSPGSSNVPTVQSQRRAAERGVDFERMAVRYWFATNAILLGMILGLIALRF